MNIRYVVTAKVTVYNREVAIIAHAGTSGGVVDVPYLWPSDAGPCVGMPADTAYLQGTFIPPKLAIDVLGRIKSLDVAVPDCP